MNETLEMDNVITGFGIKRKLYKVTKRMFDIFMSLIGIFAMIPVALVVKVSYLLHGDKKSIFYKQKRIGKNGEKFELLKFRSMVWNADEVLKELLKQKKYKKQWDKYQKIDNDPRITKVGNLLRKTSLDELPQMINVLRGEMSLIGPRPLIEGELDAHGGNHDIYEKVRPGLTSWWAVNGRSNLEYSDRLALEYYYVNHMSLQLDIKCIIKTVMVVFKKSGAK